MTNKIQRALHIKETFSPTICSIIILIHNHAEASNAIMYSKTPCMLYPNSHIASKN
jgi:hypothetical protein